MAEVEEPIYSYIKGQGWVVADETIVTMYCGTRVRIELRKPNPGEGWCWTYADWNLEKWKEWAPANKLEDFKCYVPGFKCDPPPNMKVSWVTFIPV